jgi:hypothetical protein
VAILSRGARNGGCIRFHLDSSEAGRRVFDEIQGRVGAGNAAKRAGEAGGMIFGSYPCCGVQLCIAMPKSGPSYMPEACPHCASKVWHRLSRIDPQSWTEAEFLAEHEVDDAAKTIMERNPQPEIKLTPAQQEAFKRAIDDYLLYGDSRDGDERPTGILNSL